MRKVCVVITSRAHYGRSKYLLEALKNHPDIELQLIVGASAVLERYGDISKELEKDGYNVNAKVTMLIEGGTPLSMSKTTGVGLLEFSTIFENLKPDIVVIRGDRFEILAPAIAAAYMNIPLAHIEGGDVTGTIDESVRHSVSKLAHIHFPTNKLSAERLIKMGEDPKNVHMEGSLNNEFLVNCDLSFPSDLFDKYGGIGEKLDLTKGYILVMQHPVTTEYGKGLEQIKETLKAIHELKIPTIMLWPNVDAGTDHISKGIRLYREQNKDTSFLHIFRNLHPEDFARVLKHCKCFIGNSSAGIIESSFLGTPAVNIGSRQSGRLRAENVIDVPSNSADILKALKQQLEHGKYEKNNLYGDGNTSKKIADILATAKVNVQKQLAY